MSEMIGVAAGKVWEYLKNNGPAPAKKIQKGIGEDAATTNQALGWLARESKLAVDRSSKKSDPTYALRE
jgi:hypothetical protein